MDSESLGKSEQKTAKVKKKRGDVVGAPMFIEAKSNRIAIIVSNIESSSLAGFSTSIERSYPMVGRHSLHGKDIGRFTICYTLLRIR